MSFRKRSVKPNISALARKGSTSGKSNTLSRREDENESEQSKKENEAETNIASLNQECNLKDPSDTPSVNTSNENVNKASSSTSSKILKKRTKVLPKLGSSRTLKENLATTSASQCKKPGEIPDNGHLQTSVSDTAAKSIMNDTLDASSDSTTIPDECPVDPGGSPSKKSQANMSLLHDEHKADVDTIEKSLIDIKSVNKDSVKINDENSVTAEENEVIADVKKDFSQTASPLKLAKRTKIKPSLTPRRSDTKKEIVKNSLISTNNTESRPSPKQIPKRTKITPSIAPKQLESSSADSLRKSDTARDSPKKVSFQSEVVSNDSPSLDFNLSSISNEFTKFDDSGNSSKSNYVSKCKVIVEPMKSQPFSINDNDNIAADTKINVTDVSVSVTFQEPLQSSADDLDSPVRIDSGQHPFKKKNFAPNLSTKRRKRLSSFSAYSDDEKESVKSSGTKSGEENMDATKKKRKYSRKKKGEDEKDDTLSKKSKKKNITPYITEEMDVNTMTMHDLIYYRPKSLKKVALRNESSSAAVEEDEGVVVGAINPKIEPSETETKPTFPQKKEEEEEDIMAPQVMIDENGQIVLNNESLTIKQKVDDSALRSSGIVYEDALSKGNHRKGRCKAKRWAIEETLRFYKALSQIGTDFTLMSRAFPGYTRKDLKQKFKREEKVNGDLVDVALSNRLPLNMDIFLKGPKGLSEAMESTVSDDERVDLEVQ